MTACVRCLVDAGADKRTGRARLRKELAESPVPKGSAEFIAAEARLAATRCARDEAAAAAAAAKPDAGETLATTLASDAQSSVAQ